MYAYKRTSQAPRDYETVSLSPGVLSHLGAKVLNGIVL